MEVGGALAGLRVTRLACGDMHSAALTADGGEHYHFNPYRS